MTDRQPQNDQDDSPSATRQALEAAALAAHARGDTWAEFWPTVAGDVTVAEPDDYFARGQSVHRLVGLVAAGDTDGMTAAGDSAPWIYGGNQAEPMPVVSDTETAARCLWKPAAE